MGTIRPWTFEFEFTCAESEVVTDAATLAADMFEGETPPELKRELRELARNLGGTVKAQRICAEMRGSRGAEVVVGTVTRDAADLLAVAFEVMSGFNEYSDEQLDALVWLTAEFKRLGFEP